MHLSLLLSILSLSGVSWVRLEHLIVVFSLHYMNWVELCFIELSLLLFSQTMFHWVDFSELRRGKYTSFPLVQAYAYVLEFLLHARSFKVKRHLAYIILWCRYKYSGSPIGVSLSWCDIPVSLWESSYILNDFTLILCLVISRCPGSCSDILL